MSKYIIKYYNKGRKISQTETSLQPDEITQDKIDIALELLLCIHKQEPPCNAVAKVTFNNRVVKQLHYSKNETV